MSWKGVPKKEPFFPLLAKEWNLLIDSVDELYSLLWGYVQHDLIPSANLQFDIGKPNLKFRSLYSFYGYLDYGIIYNLIVSKILSDLIPLISNVYDIGKPTNLWRYVYASVVSASNVKSDRADITTGYFTDVNALNRITGLYGYFDTLFAKNMPTAIDLRYVQTDILPIVPSAYRIGTEEKIFRELHSVYVYIGQMWMRGTEVQWPEFAVYLNEKLKREMENTYSVQVDGAPSSGEQVIPGQQRYVQRTVKGWYILTDADGGEVRLETVKKPMVIAYIPVAYLTEAGIRNLWIPLYYDDYVKLVWLYLTAYASIFAQLSVYEEPSYVTIW